MDFTPRIVSLRDLDLTMGGSDLRMNGELTNFIPYVFDDQTVSGSLNVSSSLLDVNEMLPEVDRDTASGTSPERESDTVVSGEKEPLIGQGPEETEQEGMPVAETADPGLPQDSPGGPAALKIPENIDFVMELDMEKVLYSDIVVKNIRGKVQVAEGTARLDRLNMDVLDGSVNTSAPASVSTIRA
jgi:hypothetical protein